jgi:hypothetical protein
MKAHPPVSMLIYDWNTAGTGYPHRGEPVELNDETLRDGLQSPSVRDPDIETKVRLLHLMDRLGIHSADLGLPGAGPRACADITALCRAIVESKLRIAPNCAVRTVKSDITPLIEISNKVGIPIEACRVHRLLADPAVCGRLVPRRDAAAHRGGGQLCRQGRAAGDVRHGGHLPRDAGHHHAALSDGDQRRREAHLRVRYRRPHHAAGRAESHSVRATDDPGDRGGHQDRLARAQRSGPGRHQHHHGDDLGGGPRPRDRAGESGSAWAIARWTSCW